MVRGKLSTISLITLGSRRWHSEFGTSKMKGSPNPLFQCSKTCSFVDTTSGFASNLQGMIEAPSKIEESHPKYYLCNQCGCIAQPYFRFLNILMMSHMRHNQCHEMSIRVQIKYVAPRYPSEIPSSKCDLPDEVTAERVEVRSRNSRCQQRCRDLLTTKPSASTASASKLYSVAPIAT